MENYEHIYYLDHPHFTLPGANQWYENGFLFHEGKVYSYEEDRNCQCGKTYSPMEPGEFVLHAEKFQITIPSHFMELLNPSKE